MKLVFKLCLAVLILGNLNVLAQSNNAEIKITGKVTDFNNQPVKNAVIFVDSVATEVTTNKRGLYKIKLSSKAQHIGVSVAEYGLLSTGYTGERKIDFVFRNPEENTNATDMKIGMVYKQDIAKTNSSVKRGTDYEIFANVLELLDKRFPFVKIDSQGTLRIGSGPSSSFGDQTPLIIIDNQRANVNALLVLPTVDIKKIRVIRRGSEAATYGSLGASNGVILVQTKGDS